MLLSNLHTHTVFSDGKQTPRENVEAALARGFASIGISDHSYTDFDLRYCMRAEKVDEYLATIRALKEEYAGRIEVYAGLEYDGYTDLVAGREAFDYLLGDCHYIKTSGGYFSIDHCKEGHEALCNDWFGGDYTAFAKSYFEGYTACMQSIRPDVLGHFDLVSKFCLTDESSPAYRRYATEALIDCLAVTPLIELNTGAIARGHRAVPYPAPYLWKEVVAHGGKFVFSSDSHDIANLDFYFAECAALLKQNGIRSVAVLKNGAFQEVGLD